MKRFQLYCDITAWGLVLGAVIGLGLYCVGIDQYHEDRENHRQTQYEGGSE